VWPIVDRWSSRGLKAAAIAIPKQQPARIDNCALNMAATPMDVSEPAGLDEDLHSRQIAVYGREAMSTLATATILVSGVNGLGVEIGACGPRATACLLCHVAPLTPHRRARAPHALGVARKEGVRGRGGVGRGAGGREAAR
jgi:hypothetical protein